MASHQSCDTFPSLFSSRAKLPPLPNPPVPPWTTILYRENHHHMHILMYCKVYANESQQHQLEHSKKEPPWVRHKTHDARQSALPSDLQEQLSYITGSNSPIPKIRHTPNYNSYMYVVSSYALVSLETLHAPTSVTGRISVEWCSLHSVDGEITAHSQHSRKLHTGQMWAKACTSNFLVGQAS